MLVTKEALIAYERYSKTQGNYFEFQFKTYRRVHRRVNPTARNNQPICIASELGYDDIVKLLLEDTRINPSVPDNLPLLLAAKGGHKNVMALLIADKRVDPSISDCLALRKSCILGYTGIVIHCISLLLIHYLQSSLLSC